MAPKRAKTQADTSQVTAIPAAPEDPQEDGPPSLEDLPNDVLGEILQRLKGLDLLRLTMVRSSYFTV